MQLNKIVITFKTIFYSLSAGKLSPILLGFQDRNKNNPYRID